MNRVRRKNARARKRKLKALFRKQTRGTPSGDPFFRCEGWMRVRYAALVRHKGRCMACGASGANVRLHVDHIKPRARYPELALEISNLQILCEPCNLGKGCWDETDWRPPENRILLSGPFVPSGGT